MLKISKIVKLLLVLLFTVLLTNNIAFATDINMNLPSNNEASTYDNDTSTDNIDSNTSIEDTTTDTNSITSSDTSQDDIGGTVAPSSVSSIAEENMSLSNILNILLIAVGVVLILLAIAILIRLKS